MPYTVHFRDAEDLVEVVNVGTIDHAELLQQTIDGYAEMVRHGVLAVMVNCQEGEIGFASSDFYWLPKFYDDKSGDRRVRIAVIRPRSPQSEKGLELYKEAATNRGYKVALFDERDSAVEWLRHVQA